MRAGMTFDYVIRDHGSLCLCEPQNDAAREWLADHVSEEAQWWGGALAVEPRYVDGLVDSLDADGFTCRVTSHA